MPALSTNLSLKSLMRILMYGPSKTRKTWLAATAAEAGFNVIFIATEPGTAILRNLSQAAQERIYVIDVCDTGNSAKAAEFLAFFCRNEPFWWDEEAKRYYMSKQNENCIYINWNNFDKNTFVIVDSYSALAWSLSMRYALENKIDLADAKKPDWEGYRWCGSLATWMITQLVKLPCHFTLIGHAEVYEKRSKDQKSVEWQRTQMKSTSGPHAMTIAQEFDEVMFFRLKGPQVWVDLRPQHDRDSGGRIIEPKEYKWEDLQIQKIFEHVGYALPPADLKPVIELLKPGENVSSGLSSSSIKPTENKSTSLKVEKKLASSGLKLGIRKS